MLKILICPHRHPAMTRSEFFDHLRNKHAPLVLSDQAYMRHLRRYIQNHTRLPEDGFSPALSYRWAQDRDSVIELWYDSVDALLRANQEPSYLQNIRPDEKHFNDHSSIVLVFANEEQVFASERGAGSLKIFDFVARSPGLDIVEFQDKWRAHGAALAQNVAYRSVVTRRVHNKAIHGDAAAFVPPSAFDGVAETWLHSYDGASVDVMNRLDAAKPSFIDPARSFSVIAIEVPIHNPLHRGT